jgi:6-phosphofructokinase 1
MKRIGVLTSGGDSPGMNAAIRAVVRTGVAKGLEVFGIRHGYQGMIDGEILPMDARSVSGIINRGGTILHTARCMAFMEPEGRVRAAEQLAQHGIEGIVAVGGDGTYRGADKLHAEHGIRCIGLPGTIDNDIGGTQYTIGFDTALNIAVEAVDRIRDTADSHDRLFFIEVMGRHSGFIAIMASIAGGAEEVLVPEEACDVATIVARLQLAKSRGKTSMIVIIAEGDEQGNAFTVAKRVADISEFKDSRVAVVGHLQRGGSPTAFDRILASRMGVRAVEALIEGATGMMVGIENQEMVLNPLSSTWEKRSTFSPDLLRVSRLLAT